MSKVLIIGAGGVATVAAHKVAQNIDTFGEMVIASRTLSKCDALAEDILRREGVKARTAQVDADSVEQLVALFKAEQPDIVMNLALPYQDLTIMEACLQTGCNYLDTANYEPKDEAHFEYSWQWAYRECFEQAG
ncbi:MAG: saccharopine dehydrogenase NADP-binding domain-containing protein, partial [Bacteroidaceae bacterium]|nr:saccharopine dehydrogenase NADP-binding domain-containing protein [Bacteroidaceae bacterium]